MSRTHATLPDRLKIERGWPGRCFFRWPKRSSRFGGRWMKRQLSKARRRAWKHELRTGEPGDRHRLRWERECNWKGW